MQFIETKFQDLYVVIEDVLKDDRGYLIETFNEDILLKKFSFKIELEIEVESKKNVLRGMHYQEEPYAQAKIIRVLKGAILDVVVDLRKGSETFGKNFSIILDSKDHRQLYVPKGFAHGYYVLSKTAKVNYKMNNIYSKNYARGIIYNDSSLNIDWGLVSNPILSKHDKNLPILGDVKL